MIDFSVFGFDWHLLWLAGGSYPYSIEGFFYPPALIPLFILFNLLPEWGGFYLLSLLTLIIMLLFFKRDLIARILSVPFWFHISVGQISMLFYPLIRALSSNKLCPYAAAMLTLKPQLFAVFAPWHVVRWDRRSWLRFLFVTFVLWVYPLFVWGWQIYIDWIYSLPAGRMDWIALIFVPIAIYLLKKSKDLSQYAIMASSYFTPYDMLLLEKRMSWLFALLTWIALFASAYFHSQLPFRLLLMVVVVWNLAKDIDLISVRRHVWIKIAR